MRRSIGGALGVLACSTLFAVAARAQSGHSVFVEATLGANVGQGGGQLRNRTGIAADALVGVRLSQALRGKGAIGLGMGWQGAMAGADDCPLATWGGCLGDFPKFFSLAALAGAELGRAHGATVRLLAGPAYFREDEGESALGGQARLDLSTPALYHVAIVASARVSVLPSFHGNAYSLAAFGLGLRVR